MRWQTNSLPEKAKMKRKLKPVEAVAPLKLDLGCGKNKKPGFIGVDTIKFDGVDTICQLNEEHWHFSNNIFGNNAHTRQDDISDNYEFGDFLLDGNSVDEVHCSHFIEHLTQDE